MDANDPGTPPPTPQDPPASPQESSPLLLPSLRIENFRGFKELTIPKLGRVNLIVGKNGVGKTSILEALSIHLSSDPVDAILSTLESRDEYSNYNVNEITIYDFNGLFHGRPRYYGVPSQFSIGDCGEKNVIGVSMEIIQQGRDYNIRGHIMGTAREARKRTRYSAFGASGWETLVIRKNEKEIDRLPTAIVYDIKRELPKSRKFAGQLLLFPEMEERASCVSISSKGLSALQSSLLWDGIALTDAEEHVIKSVQIIAPSVRKITTISSPANQDERWFMLRTDDFDTPIPFKSLGDGATRTLEFSLALVNQRNGAVLIDEFENGLHWSVQSKVWEVVFTLAERLNVQVFATTHSYDCIEAFQQAASRSREPAYLIRLDNRGPELQAVSVTGEELAYITREKIEVR